MILLMSLLPHSPYPSFTIPLDFGNQRARLFQGMGKMLMVMPVKQISHHSYPHLSCTLDHPFPKYLVLIVDTTMANTSTSYTSLYLIQRDLLRMKANLKLSHPSTRALLKISNFRVVGGYSWNFHHHWHLHHHHPLDSTLISTH